MQKKHISDKNRQIRGAGEKLLYHGTTEDNCDSIMKTGFNRRFAGQNGNDHLDKFIVIKCLVPKYYIETSNSETVASFIPCC